MKKPGFYRRFLPVLLLSFSIFILLVFFRVSNFNTVSSGTWTLLEETTTRKRTLLYEKFQGYKTLVSSLSFAYRDDFALSGDALLSSLGEIEANTGFDYIRFIDKEGMSHTSKGDEADCSDRPYFTNGIKGEVGVCDVQNSRLNGESMIGFYAPVQRNGENIGVLVAFISQRNLSFLLESQIFGYNVDAFIITKEGMIVGCDNVSLLNENVNTVKGPQLNQKVRQYTYSEERGVRSLTGSGMSNSDQVFISKITENYFLLMSFPLSSINDVALFIGTSGNNLFLSLLAVLIFCIIYSFILAYFSRKRNRLMQNLIVEGIVDNEDAVFLLNNEDVVEIIKESNAINDIDASIGSKISLEKLIASFRSKINGPKDDFSFLFYNAVCKVRKEKGNTERFVSSFYWEGEIVYLQFMFRSDLYGKEPVVVITIRFVTDIIEKEQKEREKIQEALEKAEAAAKAKSTFLANMSHDLRTPMNAIIGYTNLALSNLTDTKKEKGYLLRITDSSKQLLSLLNDILDMTLIEGGKISMEESLVSIRDIFASIESLTETSVAAKGQMFHISVENLLHESVFVDKVRLNQILLNCVTNAIKYTPEGGDVWLKVEEEGDIEEGKARFVFSIKDNGIGMSKDFLDKIWEPFERERNTTVSKIQGTGLGMAITKNLVSLMNGEIMVKSQEGKGSEFIITLDLEISQTKQGSISTYCGRKALVAGATKTIQSLPSILERMGFSVLLAQDYSETLEYASGVNLVLLDMTIVRNVGMEALKEIRDRAGKDAIFIVTTYKLKEGEDLEKYGVDAYAPKPVFMSDLQRILSTCPKEDGKLFVTRKEMDLRGKRVLLVEDNDLNREIAQTVLEDIGMMVECAMDGKMAVEMVENAEEGHYDIVLMDIQMPIMDGYEASRRIRSLKNNSKANVPILSMTANAFPEDRIKALEAGMNGHVPKPFEVTLLVSEIIEAILSRG